MIVSLLNLKKHYLCRMVSRILNWRSSNTLNHERETGFSPVWLGVVALLFVVLFSRATSFLYAFEGADPSIFKQMCRAVLRGKTMYIDYFDNKGCLLYFIHALGLWLGGDIVLLLMQAVSLTITLVIWDKMLALYRNRSQRRVCLGVALLMLFCFYGAGDQTQEWCLPFISYPLLLYFRAYKTKTDLQPKQMFLIGLCFGVITFIQINNACAFLGFIAYLWIHDLFTKNFKKLFKSIVLFVIGWSLVAIPCILYFYVKAGWHGVYEMVYAMLLSNLEYMGIQHYMRWFHWLPYSLFLLSFLSINILGLRKQKAVLAPILISLALFVGTFGKLCNSFYLIALLPLCIVSMMTIDSEGLKKAILSLGIIAMGCVVFLGSISFFHVVNDLFLRKEKEVVIYDRFHQCLDSIPVSDRDSIFNYNMFWHGYGMMEHEELLQCNRVSVAYDLPTLMEEEKAKPRFLPKWIMISFELKTYEADARFILSNYELISQFSYDRLYLETPRIGNQFNVYFLRRIDEMR